MAAATRNMSSALAMKHQVLVCEVSYAGDETIVCFT
jgi:hypothetical protein